MTGNHAALFRQVVAGVEDSAPDGTLLVRFVADRDEGAFAELVRRYGPMVFGVCRRAAGHHHDAEDAFQATFLVLAQKAGRIDRPTLLGNWLYGVAVRVAGKARQRAARLRTGVEMPDPPAPPVAAPDETSALIDAELARLPAHYRDAVVLCDVQGVPRTEAATRLGVSDGTLSSRLTNGRKKLAARLAKRGVTLPAAGTFLIAVPDALARRTVDGVLGWSAGAAVPYSILELTRTGGSAMRYAIGAAILTSVGLAAGAATGWTQESKQEPPKKAEVAGKVEEPKPAKPDGPVEWKPKRLKTFELDFDATTAHWSSDGRYMVAEGSGGCVAIDTREFQLRGTLFNSSTWKVIGFLPGRAAFLCVTPNSTRINAAHQLSVWEWTNRPRPADEGGPESTLAWVKTKTVELDAHPGYWSHVLPDGKHVVSISATLTYRKMPDPGTPVARNTYTVHVIEIETGRSQRDIPLTGGDLLGSEVSPDGSTLLVFTNANPKVGVELLNLSDGQSVWKRTLTGVGRPNALGRYCTAVFSPDGKRVTVCAPFELGTDSRESGFGGGRGGRPGPIPGSPGFGQGPGSTLRTTGIELQTLDVGTGKPLPALFPADRVLAGATLGGYTRDGKLAAGVFSVWEKETGALSFVEIWDTESGNVVKTWSGTAVPSFGPGKPLLALFETYFVREANVNQSRKTSLGFWDFAAPAK